jgi:hypothetical protein
MRSGAPSSHSTGTRLREESTPPTKPSIAPPAGAAQNEPERAAVAASPLAAFQQPAPSLNYRMVLVITGAALGFGGLLAFARHEEGWLAWGPWVVAAVTLVFSLSMAFAITLSFARRLDALSLAARRLAFGRPSDESDPARGDAIAALARCLTRLSERIRELNADLERSSEQEQARLDGLVRERTRDLGEENDDLRRVLGDSKGVLSVDANGKLIGQFSSVISKWLGTAPHEARFWNYFEQASPGAGVRFENAWAELMSQTEFDLRRLPRTLAVGERYLAVEYRAVRERDGELRRMLIVLSDITIPEPDPATPI